LPIVLGAASGWLAVVYLGESVAGWRRWLLAQHAKPGLTSAPDRAGAVG
jgi:hypothetical protein